MGRREKLLEAARTNPKGLRFEDLCALAVEFGYEFRRINGSHHIYKRANVGIMTFQPSDGGRAKSYQVQQLIDKLVELGDIPEE